MDSNLKADAVRLGLQAALMRELQGTPMWACYGEYLNTMIEETISRLLSGSKDEFEYRKGIVMGLRDALRVPDNIIMWAEQANQN